MRYFVSILSLLLALTMWHTVCNAETEAIKKYDYNIDREQIVEKFHKLSKSGGLIESPKLPEEYYYNATIYTQKGDLIKAREAYESFFRFNIPFVDPIQKYIDILKTQEKDSNIAYILEKTNNNKINPAFDMYIALQNKNVLKRIENLELLAIKHNQFAPIHYFIAFELNLNSPNIHKMYFESLGQDAAIKKTNLIYKKIVDESKRAVTLFDQGYGYVFYFDKLSARTAYDILNKLIENYGNSIRHHEENAVIKNEIQSRQRLAWVSGIIQTAAQPGTPEQIRMAISAYEDYMKKSGLNDKEINEIKKEALSSDNILKAKREQNKQLKQMGLTDDQIDRMYNPNKPYQYFAGDNGVVASVTVNNLVQAFKLAENNKIDEIRKMKKNGSLVIIPKGSKLNLISQKWEFSGGLPLVKIKYNEQQLWTTPDQLTTQ